VTTVHRRGRLRVLLVQLEFTTWRRARHWSYAPQLGFEDGLRANGVECFTVLTPWLPHLPEICAGQRFDQVWVEIVHNDLSETILEWLARCAPVRVGFVGESLSYTEETYLLAPHLRTRRAQVEHRLGYLTHVLAVDEADVADIEARRLARAMWWVTAVPRRFIAARLPPPVSTPAAFTGAVYGERERWLAAPELSGLIVHQPSPDEGTLHPQLFDLLHRVLPVGLRGVRPARWLLPAYLHALRALRRRSFARWIEAMRGACAVVNLPSWIQAYPGRVFEGMAAGRPVISWAIPDRPRTTALFENDVEVLFFDRTDPKALAARISQVLADPRWAAGIAAHARDTLLRFHTAEGRTAQILDWLADGREPSYR
jgi:glycosyltransferase involved in cell wall biosynthesis